MEPLINGNPSFPRRHVFTFCWSLMTVFLSDYSKSLRKSLRKHVRVKSLIIVMSLLHPHNAFLSRLLVSEKVHYMYIYMYMLLAGLGSVQCSLLSVTSHINCSVKRCLINVVYLTACALIRSWWRCTFWISSPMTLNRHKNRWFRHNYSLVWRVN